MNYLSKAVFKLFGQTLLCLMTVGIVAAQTPSAYAPDKQGLLSNGWSLSPAGRSLPLGDLPSNMALTSNKKLLAVTNNGQSTQFLEGRELLLRRITIFISGMRKWIELYAINNYEKYNPDTLCLYHL